MKYTASSLSRAVSPTLLEDTWYLPTQKPSKACLGRLAKMASNRRFCRTAQIRPINQSWLGVYAPLQSAYERQRLESQVEPAWLRSLEPAIKRSLQFDWLIGEGTDPLAIVPRLDHAGFGYIISDEGLIADTSHALRLFRLQGIKQLALLHDPVLRENNREVGAMPFDHTRWLHVLTASAMATLIIGNNPTLKPISNLIRVAALSHDALTPAGGDTTKLIDPDLFDEDKHFPDLFELPDWPSLRDRYYLDEAELYQTIQGEGVAGQVLDVVDKLSYTNHDLYAYLGRSVVRFTERKELDSESYSAGFFQILDHATAHRNICGVWDSVRIVGGDVVFSSPERLANFLKLRVMMFRQLYHNPVSRFLEYLVSKAITKAMFLDGFVTREELLTYGDAWLEGQIDKYMGKNFCIPIYGWTGQYKLEHFPNEAAALTEAIKFKADDRTMVLLDDFKSNVKSGADKFLVRRRGKTVTLREARPDLAEEMDELLVKKEGVFLIKASLKELMMPKAMRLKLKRVAEPKSR
ncbi:MAG: hypothetical protein WC250_00750 [Candidatus Paceibacterota bacterium]|jgi:hypothetical protein